MNIDIEYPNIAENRVKIVLIFTFLKIFDAYFVHLVHFVLKSDTNDRAQTMSIHNFIVKSTLIPIHEFSR